MNDKRQILPLDGCVDLVGQLMSDFVKLSKNKSAIPQKRIYKIASSAESPAIVSSARMAAFAAISNRIPIKKYAFDTRRTNQEDERNPRSNLQYWSRSQQYIDEEDQKRLEAFARLISPLDGIKNKYGNHPEYFQSFARKLHESVKGVLKVKESDLDIFRPQLDYLEQLLYARYRLSLEDLTKMGSGAVEERLLSKDEDLLKRGSFINITGDQEDNNQKHANKVMLKDGDKTGLTQESIVNAIFGNNKLRREGEKTVERTITITIRDEVID